MIGLTWGGVQFPWSSARVLVPLIAGIAGLITFMVYERYIPKHPIVCHLVCAVVNYTHHAIFRCHTGSWLAERL